MLTYKKIASLAGVSESTVSKALTGNAEIGQSTVEKVRRIACEQGYYKAKRELKRNNSPSFAPHIAIICPEIISVFYSSVAEAVIERITSLGGRATVAITRFGASEAEHIADGIAHDPDFDGIISMQKLNNYPSLNIPVVFLMGSKCEGADAVGCNMDGSILALVRLLLDKGHRRIGFAGEMLTVYKENFFRQCIEKEGLGVFEEFIVRSDKRFFNVGKEAFHIYSERGAFPDALICAYDEIAVGFMGEAQKNGMRIPDDVSVVGINDTPLAEFSTPPLTTTSSRREDIAHAAYDILISRILGSRLPPKNICYEGFVVERQSVKEK